MEGSFHTNAVEAYVQIIKLADNCANYPKLFKMVNSFISQAKERIGIVLPQQLRKCQEEVGWPRADLEEDEDEQHVISFMESFQNLLIFEFINKNLTKTADKVEESEENSEEEIVFYEAVKILMEPIHLRFHFHFSTDRSTNRLDKPEWFLDHLAKVDQDCGDFVERYLQPDGFHSSVYALFRKDLAGLAREKLLINIGLIMGEFDGNSTENEQYLRLLAHTLEQAIAFLEENDEVELRQLIDASREAFEIWIKNVHTISLSNYDLILDQVQADGAQEYETDGEEKFSSLIIEELDKWIDLVSRLGSIPGLQYKLFDKSVIAILAKLLNKLEFDCPLGSMSIAEAQITLGILKFVNGIRIFISEWGEDLAFVEMASGHEFRKMAGYDATGLAGTVFFKSLKALDSLLDKLGRHVENYVYEGFQSGAAQWANAMYYSGVEDNKEELVLHDGLRRALVELEPRLSIIKDNQQLINRVYRRIGDFLIHRMILRNFLTTRGVFFFKQHLELLSQVLKSQNKHSTEIALLPVFEAISILEADNIVRNTLKKDDLEETTELLDQLKITTLSIDTCEQILASKK
jgi:hypothetical protein